MSVGDAANHPTPAFAAQAPTEVAIVTGSPVSSARSASKGWARSVPLRTKRRCPAAGTKRGQPGAEKAPLGGPVERRDVGAVHTLPLAQGMEEEATPARQEPGQHEAGLTALGVGHEQRPGLSTRWPRP